MKQGLTWPRVSAKSRAINGLQMSLLPRRLSSLQESFPWHAWLMAIVLLFSFGAHAASITRLFAWGAGTFVTTNSSDVYNYGQCIVPLSLSNGVLAAGGWRHSMALNLEGTLV